MKKSMMLASKSLRAWVIAGSCALIAGQAIGAVEELHDEDLSAVTGSDGVRIDLHLGGTPTVPKLICPAPSVWAL